MANVGAARQSRWVRPKPGPKVPSLVLLLSWVGCAVGCHNEAEHADCASIAPGTPVADIPVSGEGFTPYCSPASGASAEVGALWCSREGYFPSNGSVKDCGVYGIVDCAKIVPAETRVVGRPYGDWPCAPDEGFGAPKYGCYVWVRDGGVLGVCEGCPPD